MNFKKKKLTPNYHHVCDRSLEFRGKVYEPEADSFLFLDALDADKQHIHQLCTPTSPTDTSAATTILEIGVGSGIVLSHCCFHCIPESTSVACFGVDINRTALKATKLTWEATRRDRIADFVERKKLQEQEEAAKDLAGSENILNGNSNQKQEQRNNDDGTEINSSTIPSSSSPPPLLKHSTLTLLHTSGLDPVRTASIDILLFNPPYVPTSTEEMLLAQKTALDTSDELPAAWAGGIDGREICDAILPKIPSVLTYPYGVAYIVALQENDIDDMLDVLNEAATGMGRRMGATIVALRWTGEHLRVVRFEFVG